MWRAGQGAPEHPDPELPGAGRTVRQLPRADLSALPGDRARNRAALGRGRVALRLALADAGRPPPYLGVDRAHGDRLRPPDPAGCDHAATALARPRTFD